MIIEIGFPRGAVGVSPLRLTNDNAFPAPAAQGMADPPPEAGKGSPVMMSIIPLNARKWQEFNDTKTRQTTQKQPEPPLFASAQKYIFDA